MVADDIFWTFAETVSWLALRRIVNFREVADAEPGNEAGAFAHEVGVKYPESREFAPTWDATVLKGGSWGAHIGWAPRSEPLERLLRLSCDGKIRLAGRSAQSKLITPIPPAHLVGLRFHFLPDGLWSPEAHGLVFDRLRFAQRDVMAYWKPRPSNGAKSLYDDVEHIKIIEEYLSKGASSWHAACQSRARELGYEEKEADAAVKRWTRKRVSK